MGSQGIVTCVWPSLVLEDFAGAVILPMVCLVVQAFHQASVRAEGAVVGNIRGLPATVDLLTVGSGIAA